MRTLPGTRFYDLAFSPDGKLIATVSENWLPKTRSRLRVLDMKSGRLLWSAQDEYLRPNNQIGTSEIRAVQFSPDGKFVLTSNGISEITFRDVKTTEKIFTLQAPELPATDLATHDPEVIQFSGDGKTLLNVSHNCTILWDYAEIQKRLPRS
jgi:WD40 repeat protein